MRYLIYTVMIMFWTSILQSQVSPNSLTHGYRNGTIIGIGGGEDDDLVIKEFKKYAGGDSAKIVVIPTALPQEYLQQDSAFFHMKKWFENYGFYDVTILHTSNLEDANNEDFIEPIETATGIFFTGGRQWRIADSFLNTKAHEEMFKLLDRGGVIAGSSAGATILGSYLARGDTKNNQIMMGDHETGLGFISNIAIDQHVLARNRQFDMFDILDKKPELLGIGIDENTAIVVHGDTLQVIGKSYVLIYDKSLWSREGIELKNTPNENDLFYFLQSGDKYNLRERKVINK